MSTIYTTLEKINIAKVSQYLCINAITKSGLWGGGQDLNLPRKIYCVRKNVEWLYDLDPSDDTLTPTGNYLLALCAPYSLLAASIISAGGGGTISPINPNAAQQYPIYITQADFSTATLYPNTNIFGTNIIIYYNEIQRYLIPGTEFTVDATGVTITLAGFDSQFDCNMIIEKYFN